MTSRASHLSLFRSTILLTLGLLPAASAGCKTMVIIDCTNAKPLPDGLVDCGPVEARPKAPTCTLVPTGNMPTQCTGATGYMAQTCHSDSNCNTYKQGRCDDNCECFSTCATDADCESGQACLCGENGGKCVAAFCRTSADCKDGGQCILHEQHITCGGGQTIQAFACTTGDDECHTDAECGAGKFCVSDGTHFYCDSLECHTGRPFYVEGRLTLAPLRSSGDWPSSLAPDTALLPAEVRAALARRWSHVGQLEHASVASFARFAMQLLSLGAPPDLVEQTTGAMADETAHARLAFGLASAYAGAPVGPDRLDVAGALAANDPATILRTLVHEGCVGETVAAALAREERARTADPVVAAVLDRIAEDEERHAMLAFRALGWLLRGSGRGREMAAVLDEECRQLSAELLAGRSGKAPAPEASGAADLDLARHGVLSDAEMAENRRAVLSAVVLPVLRACLGERDHLGTGARMISFSLAALAPAG
jgi:hypothetical protein